MLPSNAWNSAVIRKRLHQEAAFDQSLVPEKDQYYILACHPDTKLDQVALVNFDVGPLDPPPHEMQMAFASTLREELQKNWHHDGFWLVGFTHPPSTFESIKVDGDNCWNRFLIIWADKDGDIKFPFETEEQFVEILKNGLEYYVNTAEKCWQAWNEAYGAKAIEEEFGIKDEQMSKPVLASLN